GKEVIAPKTSMTVFGWTGAGYIIYDPVTGDGAYKISGGAKAFTGSCLSLYQVRGTVRLAHSYIVRGEANGWYNDRPDPYLRIRVFAITSKV
ncbi:MAG: hypothetical protein Q9M19_00565, partial [Mariprofundaceae bacterium]|nr:hypothetical protein [Mariprofundaceae bacterium]